MKRSWLIGAALVFSLTAVGCKDDDEDETLPDSGTPADAGGGSDAGSDAGSRDAGLGIVGIDSGVDGGLDSGRPDSGVIPSDASVRVDSSVPSTTDAGGLDGSL